MKNLKTYEYWTTDTSGGVKVNYGDTPNVSEFVINLIDYIDENYYFIEGMQYDSGLSINFKDKIIKRIIVRRNSDAEIFILIKKTGENYEQTTKYITQTDFNYFKIYFDDKLRTFKNEKNKNREEDILDIIDPIRRNTKKYNI